MPPVPSVLSLAAASVYALVLLTCIWATVTSSRTRQPAAHWRGWLFLAVLFGVLMVLRLVAAEEWVRATVRASLRASGEYGERRSVQAPLVAAILMMFGLGALGLFYRATRNLQGRRNVARLVASTAGSVMIALLVVRIASLHILDQMLYGPLKLNWVLDIGASLVVILAAIQYVRIVRGRS